MQLFINDYIQQWSTITISNPELLSQIRKVLRAKIGDIFYIQSPNTEEKKTRYQVRIEQWDNIHIRWIILSEQIHVCTSRTTKMIVAMPNTWNKAELIAQKLSEIGISEIIFWPSERSIIKVWNHKKEARIQKIIKEATEQSRWRNIPKIIFTTTLDEHIQNAEVIVFDKQEIPFDTTKTEKNLVWIVWPEGGFTEKDYTTFDTYTPRLVDLGSTVLRMETAAIIWWRKIKNKL